MNSYVFDSKCVFYAANTAEKVVILKAMNELVSSISDENAYMHWISVVPDQATEDDFLYIAEDQELCDEVTDLFAYIMNRYVVREYKREVKIQKEMEDC